MTEDDLIVLEDVRKIYQMGEERVHALAGVSITFKKGDFWAIMGPSGSGKSTMMNLIGCLDRPTSGNYRLNNHDVSQLNDDQLSNIRLQNIGFIFQSFNLIPQLTVLENIELPMFYQDLPPEHCTEKATEMAKMVGLGSRLKHRPSELSGGQQQRVAIARSLVNDPPLILADEPTGNLDTATGDQILNLLIDQNQQGKTVIIITHERDVAAHAKHNLHMRDGIIDRTETNGI
ncbi:MAG TPA: ABC transporter ATP-binding protein [Verrucomicrobiales bacterium]|nr:ABC transporter ATP-binding protein [Verrucomicrobiales bacterium]HIL68933.1 ABC transporter ATP-binding protein [Verrucomicrobiota bacterium]